MVRRCRLRPFEIFCLYLPLRFVIYISPLFFYFFIFIFCPSSSAWGLGRNGDAGAWRATLGAYTARVEAKRELLPLDSFYRVDLPLLLRRSPKPFVSKFELLHVLQWKLSRGQWRPRLVGYAEAFGEAEVEAASRVAFAVPDVARAVSELTTLKGVGPATASAIITAFGPEIAQFMSDDRRASWDSVVTCFFLDTAHSTVEYIEIISKILKDGGIWINLGPLLYRFADSYGPEDEMSIELSLEDVKKIAYHYGFELKMEKIIETTYTENLQSMMQKLKLRHFGLRISFRLPATGKAPDLLCRFAVCNSCCLLFRVETTKAVSKAIPKRHIGTEIIKRIRFGRKQQNLTDGSDLREIWVIRNPTGIDSGLLFQTENK